MIVLTLLVYLAIGGAAAFVLARRETTAAGRGLTAVLAVLVWPLWVPFASRRDEPYEGEPATELEQRIHRSLDEAIDAVRGTPMASLLPEAGVASIRASVRRAAGRVDELTRTVARNQRDAEETRSRIAAMESSGHGGRPLTTARVHLENLRKLARLLDDERTALLDLADLCDALRSQLVLARFAGSSVDGIGDLVSELDARVEGLDSALATVVSEVRPA